MPLLCSETIYTKQESWRTQTEHSLPDSVSSVQPQQRQHRLEWVQRGGRADEDWVLRTGVMVEAAQGAVMPANEFFRRQLNRLLDQLSAPVQRSVAATAAELMVNDLMAETLSVIDNPIEMPQNFAAISTLAMLWGNFCDACVAVVDVTFGGEFEVVLTLDAHTLGIITPRYYIRKRAQIPGAVPCSSFHEILAPDRTEFAWGASSKDGSLGLSMAKAMQNALNCQFPGPSEESKVKINQWLSYVGHRFTSACTEHSITRAELKDLAAAID